ncbi:hypothetical protein [Caballeronia cordobensis]|uniref:hypothetical protein n=1 Tax=Caballeronia cordobensis TaxID=1353886 RepID=UPI00045EE4F8|nr:hypothetical protein BRPE67_ACDS09520 [Burkholderia sp. RPE67]
MEFEFVLDAGMSQEELSTFVAAAEARITQYHQGIARASILRDTAKLRLLQRQIDECDE